ncbi:MAG: type II toxin-antitoxin system HicB family antitoxin [Truepera sp.]|nr:type II toxin-antitoxin system HicB family antitoxin [Truepera sp.]
MEYYLSLHYPVTFYPEEEGGYTVEIKDLPGCVSQGETLNEAMEMIEEARQLWLEVAYEHGDEIPLPSTDEAFSGRVLLRMPHSLHRRLSEGAEREGVSLNQHLVALLSEQSALYTVRHDIAELRAAVEALNDYAFRNRVQPEMRF